MNSTSTGNFLEEKIYRLLSQAIDGDRFLFKKNCCKIFRKKGYHSKDREKEIVFDVSIEVYFPGASDFSILMLIECKNYNHSVPVDDAEEFFAKSQQISGANLKCIIASTNAFQAGTRTYSKSKGIGLLRYFSKKNLKWELMRSPSAGARPTNAFAADLVEEGLSKEDYSSNVFDLYCQSPVRNTNSLWDFVEDFLVETPLAERQFREIQNPISNLSTQVKFLEKVDLENKAAEALLDIGYSGGAVSLDAICEHERARCNLKVLRDVDPPDIGIPSTLLGRIVFEPLEIHLFKQVAVLSLGRERFTLAHELAHHLLDHARYMSREYCDESDEIQISRPGIAGTDISRMEFQANYLAGCLLPPRSNLINDFRQLTQALAIPKKGHGALYVDQQPCNIESYHKVTAPLMQKYGTSRTAVSIRLEELGLLIDTRASTSFQSAHSAANFWGETHD